MTRLNLRDLSKQQIKRLEEGDLSVLREMPTGRSIDSPGNQFNSADTLAFWLEQHGFTVITFKEWVLQGSVVTPRLAVREYPFARDIKKKYRLDVGFLMERVAIEADGGGRIVVEDSEGKKHAIGGRHNSDTDRWRNNTLAVLGWRKLTFSTTMLNREPIQCIECVKAILGMES